MNSLKKLLLALMPKDKFLITDDGVTKVLICYKLFGSYVATRKKRLHGIS